MITGFDDITYDLTDYEKDVLLPKIVAGLSTKKGKSLAITNKKMVEAMKARGFKTTEPRIRKLVNFIRNEGIIPGLIATSAGYYVSDDPVEIAKYVDSLKQRISAIGKVKDSMVRHLRELMQKAG